MKTEEIELPKKSFGIKEIALLVTLSIFTMFLGYNIGRKSGGRDARLLLTRDILEYHGSTVSFCKEVLFREAKGKPLLTADEHMERWKALARWGCLDYVILETYLHQNGREDLAGSKVHGVLSKLILLTNREDNVEGYQSKMNHPLNFKNLTDQALLDDFVRRHPAVD